MPPTLPTGFFFSRAFSTDPYGRYAELRAQGPVHPIDFPPGATAFLVVDHEHGRAALNDPRLSHDTAHSTLPVPAEMFFGGTMLGMDAPGHTRLRGLVARAFTARRAEELRPRIQRVADELLDAAAPETDLLDAFAFPLPIRVICDLLGVPAADHERFRRWTAALTVPALTPELQAARRAAAAEFNAYLLAEFEDRRKSPRDDLIGALVAVRDDQGTLTDTELLNGVALLLIAGHDTTVNLLGNAALALLCAPDQLALLRADPALLPNAVEELLRFDSPVERSAQRIAREDLEIAGTPVPRGSWVHVSLGAAHRDPAANPGPDRLDVTRRDVRHLAFGHGAHHCLGAPLARTEARIALGTLIRRSPALELACDPADLRWHRSGSIIRGLRALPVRGLAGNAAD